MVPSSGMSWQKSVASSLLRRIAHRPWRAFTLRHASKSCIRECYYNFTANTFPGPQVTSSSQHSVRNLCYFWREEAAEANRAIGFLLRRESTVTDDPDCKCPQWFLSLLCRVVLPARAVHLTAHATTCLRWGFFGFPSLQIQSESFRK